jgi:hypothetical protein
MWTICKCISYDNSPNKCTFFFSLHPTRNQISASRHSSTFSSIIYICIPFDATSGSVPWPPLSSAHVHHLRIRNIHDVASGQRPTNLF